MKYLGACLLFMILLASTVFSVNYYGQGILPPPLPLPERAEIQESKLSLKDYMTKDTISDIHAEIVIHDTENSKRIKMLKYVPKDGILKLDLSDAALVTLKIDNLDTEGNDYFKQEDIEPKEEKTIYLYPVGSLRGSVLSKDGGVVSGAKIKFDCNAKYGELGDIESDDFGSFSAGWLPVGSCRVYAAKGQLVGHTDVEIAAGELINADVILNKDKELAKKFGFIMILLLSVAIIFLITFIFKINIRKQVHEDFEEKSQSLTSRQKDIIKTLSPRERAVVEYIISSGNESTQAKIRNATRIPRTTLARILQSLEAKKIVNTESFGKLKEVELTGFFQGTEERVL